MKNTFFLVLALSPFFAFSQQDNTGSESKPATKTTYFGIKGGLNFSNVTNASSIGAGSQTGYHAGILVNMGGKLMSFRLEALYSRQGYNFSTDTTSGSVHHDYIYLAELLGINITHFFQIQIGPQTGYLLNAKATTKNQSTGNATADQILSYYNRFDFGMSGGIEIHPFAGILVGARYTLSLTNLYNVSFTNSSGAYYSPNIDFKNNVVQIFAGYRF
jgi:hypothetical protein